jgi:hypothetical protein
MSQFLDILDYSRQHKVAERMFREAVARSPFRPWKPGDPIAATGTRILIGAAAWSVYDLRLLDVVADALTRMNGTGALVEVFDASSMADFASYVPDLGFVHHTPVAGVWENGVLKEKASGFFARELIARMFGSSSDEIVQFVRQRPTVPGSTAATAS